MRKLCLLLTAVIMGLSTAATSWGETFSNLFVFGDSLSDSGQFPDIFAGHPTLRITNRVDALDPAAETAGVWSQYLSKGLGFGELLPSTPLFGGDAGNNYAVAGLRSHEILASIAEPGGSVVSVWAFTAVRDGYLVENAHADPRALYVIWGGGNDLRDLRSDHAEGGTSAALKAGAQQAADNVVAGVAALSAAGARYILVPNLPALGDIPESRILGPAYVDAGNDAAEAFNAHLSKGLNASAANIIQTDVKRLFTELLADPGAFGFSGEDHRVVAYDGSAFTGIPASEGAHGANSTSPDPSRYIFFDGIHPTTYAAEIVSLYSLSIIESAGQVSILGEAPLHMMREYPDGMLRHLAWVQDRVPPGKYAPFVHGRYAFWDMAESGGGSPGYGNDQYSLTAGLSYGFSGNGYAGVALGHHHGAVEVDSDRGEFHMDGLFLSLLGGWQYRGFVLAAAATIGDLDYDNITRNVRLGALLRTHRGDTRGDFHSVKITARKELYRHMGVAMGPVAKVYYGKVMVDGFREGSDLSTGLNFGDQEETSLVGVGGVFFTYDVRMSFGPVQLFSHMAYEKEFRDGRRFVRVGLNTLQGSSFSLPAYDPETGSWNFVLGLNLEAFNGWTGAITYELNRVRGGGTGQGVHMTIRRRF